ncbi:hypothetical protein JCM8547_002988 [Rhodosporidiobolus lusitaniae]
MLLWLLQVIRGFSGTWTISTCLHPPVTSGTTRQLERQSNSPGSARRGSSSLLLPSRCGVMSPLSSLPLDPPPFSPVFSPHGPYTSPTKPFPLSSASLPSSRGAQLRHSLPVDLPVDLPDFFPSIDFPCSDYPSKVLAPTRREVKELYVLASGRKDARITAESPTSSTASPTSQCSSARPLTTFSTPVSSPSSSTSRGPRPPVVPVPHPSFQAGVGRHIPVPLPPPPPLPSPKLSAAQPSAKGEGMAKDATSDGFNFVAREVLKTERRRTTKEKKKGEECPSTLSSSRCPPILDLLPRPRRRLRPSPIAADRTRRHYIDHGGGRGCKKPGNPTRFGGERAEEKLSMQREREEREREREREREEWGRGGW